MSQSTDFSLLLGEDDFHDIRAMEMILENMKYDGTFTCLNQGEDVIDWTLKQNEYRDASHTMPDLIILDIGLPGVDGIEVLKILRTDERSKYIPILMCSGSASQRDYQECVALGCNAYIQKIADLDAFAHTCRLFIEGWWRLSRQEYF